jgi:hypothetical protein
MPRRKQPLYVVMRSETTLKQPTLVAECENWEVAFKVVSYLQEVCSPCALTVKRVRIQRRAARIIYANRHWQAPDVVARRIAEPIGVFR